MEVRLPFSRQRGSFCSRPALQRSSSARLTVERKEEIQEEPEEEEPEEEVQEESEEEPEEEIQEEPEEKPEQESAESRQVEMTANGGLPIVNPEDMSRVWHFAIQAMPDEDDIELALEYLEELAERSSRAVPRSVVKITGQKLNQKGLVKSIDKLLGKTILIEDAADMNERVINEFCKIIDPTDRSLLVVFIDTPASIRHFLIDYPQLAQVVTAQFVRETYSVTELLEYARGYADREVKYGGWHGTTDFSTVWLGISALLKWLGLPGAVIAIVLMLLVPQIQYAKSDKENYF